MRKHSKKVTPKLAPAPHRIFREMTSEERKRWERAVAEEEAPENMAAARRAKQSGEAGRKMLLDAIHLLRDERERQGLSVAMVADRCDIERSSLSRLENANDSNPTVATLAAIAQALGKGIEIRLVDAKRKKSAGDRI